MHHIPAENSATCLVNASFLAPAHIPPPPQIPRWCPGMSKPSCTKPANTIGSTPGIHTTAAVEQETQSTNKASASSVAQHYTPVSVGRSAIRTAANHHVSHGTDRTPSCNGQCKQLGFQSRQGALTPQSSCIMHTSPMPSAAQIGAFRHTLPGTQPFGSRPSQPVCQQLLQGAPPAPHQLHQCAMQCSAVLMQRTTRSGHNCNTPAASCTPLCASNSC